MVLCAFKEFLLIIINVPRIQFYKIYILASLWKYLSAAEHETQYLLKSFSSRMLSKRWTLKKKTLKYFKKFKRCLYQNLKDVYIKISFPPECCQLSELWEKPNSELLQAKGSPWGKIQLYVNFHFTVFLGKRVTSFHIIITIVINFTLVSSSPKHTITNLHQNQDKVTGNKKGKKGEFEDAAGYMLTVGQQW